MVNCFGTRTVFVNLVLKRCTLPRFECPFRSIALCLEYIEDDFSIDSAALDTCPWQSIYFEFCPHFDDNLLTWLSNPDHSDEEWDLP